MWAPRAPTLHTCRFGDRRSSSFPWLVQADIRVYAELSLLCTVIMLTTASKFALLRDSLTTVQEYTHMGDTHQNSREACHRHLSNN